MPDTGYCTVDDVRRAKQDSELTGELESEDNEIVVDAITAQTEWLEKTLSRHWYVSTRPDEDTHELLPTGPKSRNDEEDIPTGGASIVGEPTTPKTWQGSYTRIELDRRDAQAVSELLVRTPDGYEDWVTEYEGGEWSDALGDDYYVRVNNGGVSQLYLDVENLYDADEEEYKLDTFSNAVYVTFDYGHEGIPDTVRKAVAMRACAKLLIDDEAALGIPDNGQLVNPESKKQAMESAAEELLEVYR